MEEEERMKREGQRVADRACGGRMSPAGHQDLSSETHAASAAMDAVRDSASQLNQDDPSKDW